MEQPPEGPIWPGQQSEPPDQPRRDPSGPDLSGLRRLSPEAPPAKPPEAKINPIRVLIFVVAAAAVVAVPWVVFTKLLGDSGPARPRPTSSSSPTASASPTDNPVAGTYEVTGAIKCARVRIAPGTDQTFIDCLAPGFRVRADGMSEDADGFTWLHIHDSYINKDGWMATKYLTKIS